jgi:flavin-dependent dehydrogenase
MAISVDVRTPLKEVVHGNVVLAGDSMGGMTGIMGGVASGYQAVKAIQKQEKNLPGFQEYHDWFYQAFACFVCHDHDKRRMMHRLLRKVCTDDEVDYIYRKLEKRTCHPAFVVFEEPEIFQDRPELYQKAKGLISQIGQIPLSF